MVADGHAWAFIRYSRDYVEEEREAAAVRAGVHEHRCKPAWQWRSERRYLWPCLAPAINLTAGQFPAMA
jgi:endonuclease YncB( thermonuclease family)